METWYCESLWKIMCKQLSDEKQMLQKQNKKRAVKMMYCVAKKKTLWSYDPCDWHTVTAPEAGNPEAARVREACRLCVSGLVRQAPCASDKSVKPSKQKAGDDISICEDLHILTVMIRLGPLRVCISVCDRLGSAAPLTAEFTSDKLFERV